jgi:hypothetical protein
MMDAQRRSILKRPGWPAVENKVGHVDLSDAKVSGGLLYPFILKVCSILTDDRESRPVGGVKSCRTDNGVDLPKHAICSYNAGRDNFLYRREMYVYVILLNGANIWNSWRDPATSNGEVRQIAYLRLA